MNGLYDPLGLACPFVLRFKSLMKELSYGQNGRTEWDKPLEENQLHDWKVLIAEAVQTSSLIFPRRIRPEYAVGQPYVIGCEDGALPAFSTGVYLQWEVECTHDVEDCDEDFEAGLLWAKARVTPMAGLTPPRAELDGMVLESRSCLTTVKALSKEPSMSPKGVVMLSDSTCSIAAVVAV